MKAKSKLFLFIILSFLIYKLLILFSKGPLLADDTPHYIEYAQLIMSGSFLTPDAMRTPGYPLILALFRNLTLIVVLQIAMGLASVLILYKMLVRLGYEKFVLPVITLVYVGPVSFADLKILPDTMTFLLLCSMLYLLVFWEEKKGFHLTLLVLLTILLILTKPQFGVVVICIGTLFLIRKQTAVASLLIGVSVVTIGGYSFLNYYYNNYFGMTSLLSFSLVNHTGYYIEEAKDINPKLVEIYLDSRDKMMNETSGRQEFTLGLCRETLLRELNVDNIGLAKELDRINYYLIVNYPLNYLKTIYYSVLSIYTHQDGFYGYKITSAMRYLQILTYIFFTIGFLLLFSKLRDKGIFMRLLLVVFFSNFIAAILLDSGETFRHILPTVFIPYFVLIETLSSRKIFIA